MEILCRRAKRAYVQNCSPAKTQETELCHSMGRHHSSQCRPLRFGRPSLSPSRRSVFDIEPSLMDSTEAYWIFCTFVRT